MKHFFVLISFVLSLAAFSQSGAYEKAWKALDANKRDEAERLLLEAEKDPATFQDAYLSKIYLKSYNGKEDEITDFLKSFYTRSENPSPYVYALWFNTAVLGESGKKRFDHQVELVDQLMEDSKAHGTIASSAHYQKGLHNLFSNDFDKTQKYYDAIGSIRNWQYTGPFENLSQSGFFKNYGPLEHPEPGAVFKSITNADVKWITPPAEVNDGWTPVSYQFGNQTAVVYAQNFVTSAADQPVYCNVGVSGSIKVWINDELVIAESKERVTDMDAYTVKCDLKKGVNRVLVQLGYTRTSYPNFNIRFTDEKFKPLPGITGSATYAAYPKLAGSTKKYTLLPHFAEAFFQDKIVKQPGNLLNYLLLADVYLRSKKVIEARNLISEAIEKAPDNCLLKMKMVEVLIRENNRTLLLEEIEKIKQADAESLIVLDLKIKELFDNQKYEDGAVELNKRISLYGEDESTAAYKIMLLVQEKKYEELIKEAEMMFKKYPDNPKFIALMYAIKKDVYKDKKGAMKVYENFMKDNYDYEVYKDYADLLAELGSNEKALDIKKKLAESFPYSPSGFYNMSKYYYSAKQYDKSEEYIRRALALAPYSEGYWEQLGDIKNERNNTTEALDAYNQSLKYDPNQYTILNKIRKLNGKSELYKVFPESDITKVIKEDKLEDAKNTDYGYYYILDQKEVILYPGGANEEYYTIILRITNEKGVNRYKESSIGYGNSQSLLIEKAEIIKKNQSKIDGERNENEIVFTNLEAGDVIVFKYRLRSYVYGRFAKEYWDRYYFGGQIYTATTKYHLLVPADLKINYVFNNSTVQPVIKDVENFKQYSWEIVKPVPEKDEPLMPELSDVSTVLHVSTIPDWKEIADWYSDICNNKAEEDFEIIALYKKLFPDGQKPMTQFQKAKKIYEYIEDNIRYSSVSFRQSAYVPQRASATLTTRLGDCKDLSSLFVTLAHMAGINAQMVLVNTRDNGDKEIMLPSVEFNHCIVRATLDNKKYYIELTDNNLPFASVPNNLGGSAILEIPSKNIKEAALLQALKADNRTKDVVKRVMDIKPVESDLGVSVKTTKFGSLSSGVRDTYKDMDNEKQLKEMEKSIANGYKNNVKLEQVTFKDLAELEDSVVYSYSFKVKNEISEIGAIKTFRITYPDVVASLDNFSAETRTYPIAYWQYEDVDVYETIVTITAPAGSKFMEVPASETLTFKDMKFTLQYTLKAPDKLVVTRRFANSRENIPAADYVAFKTFFEKIVKAEQKFIAYK
ncbi:MAG: transglutaminase domain-containing protein [Chitinophagaceae bacterium]